MKKLIITLVTILSLGVLFAPAAYAFDPLQTVCSGGGPATTSTLCQGYTQADPNNNPLTGTKGLIRIIANVIAYITGIAAIFTIIAGGFAYITSGGDANKAKTARNAIIGALAGLVIILLADTILGIVLNRIVV